MDTRYTYHPQDWWYRLFWLINVNNGKWKRETDEVTNWWLFGDFGKAMDWTRGQAYCKGNGNCKVKVFISKSSYQVLDTDYDNYSIVYGCDQKFGLWYTETTWLLARTRTVDDSVVENAKNVLRNKVPHYPIDVKWSGDGVTYQGDDCKYNTYE